MIAWLQANWSLVVVPFLIAVADFAFAINPAWESNGLIHWVYLQLGGKKTPPAA